MLDIRKERCLYILQSLEAIQIYMQPIASASDFLNPKMGSLHLDAVTLHLQVIGENAKQIEAVYPSFFADELNYDAGPVIRLRDFISHHYEKRDFEIIYDICVRKLPAFQTAIESYLNKK